MTRGTLLSSIVFFFCLFPFPGIAHEAEEASVGISLRDKAIELRVNVDLAEWIETVTGLRPRLDRAEGLEPLLLIAYNNLREAKLSADGENLPLTITHFPDVAEVLAQPQRGEHEGHLRFTIWMSAVLANGGAKDIRLSMPKELGPVIMSFSQPVTRWIPKGSTGSFSIRNQASGKVANRSPPLFEIGLAFAFAALAGLSWYYAGRKTKDLPQTDASNSL